MSSEPKWTTAPWNLDVCADGAPHAIGATDPKDNMYFQLASIWGEDVDTVESEMSLANAQLIAAAPELYDALENLLIVAPYDTPEEYNYWSQAKEALAKGRGES